MDTTWKAQKDVWQLEGVAKMTQTTLRNIVPTKLNAQTCQENYPTFSRTWNIYTKVGKIVGVKYKRNIPF